MTQKRNNTVDKQEPPLLGIKTTFSCESLLQDSVTSDPNDHYFYRLLEFPSNLGSLICSRRLLLQLNPTGGIKLVAK